MRSFHTNKPFDSIPTNKGESLMLTDAQLRRIKANPNKKRLINTAIPTVCNYMFSQLDVRLGYMPTDTKISSVHLLWEVIPIYR